MSIIIILLIIAAIGLLVAKVADEAGKKQFNGDEEAWRNFRNAVANEKKEKEEAFKNANRCPVCNSNNIEKISTTNRAISVAALGLASGKIGKQYKCKICKHMW